MTPWEDRFEEMTKKSEDVRRKMFVDAIREKNPNIDPDLVHLTPSEVVAAMGSDERISGFPSFVLENYRPPEGKVALLYPDTERKPWTRGSTESLSYRNIYAALKNLGVEDKIEVIAISPELGPIPEMFFGSMPMYESSGLASFMVKRRGLAWNQEDFKKVIDRSAGIAAVFMDRFHGSFKAWYAIYRTPSVHERILEELMERRPFPLWKHTSKKSLSDSYLGIRKIVENIRSSL